MKNNSVVSRSFQVPVMEEKEDAHCIRGERATKAENIASAQAPAPNKLESKPSMDINESADAFIKKFRHQLLLQRLESIENYEKMLARGL